MKPCRRPVPAGNETAKSELAESNGARAEEFYVVPEDYKRARMPCMQEPEQLPGETRWIACKSGLQLVEFAAPLVSRVRYFLSRTAPFERATCRAILQPQEQPPGTAQSTTPLVGLFRLGI
jgi:hypothetical protein